MGIVWVPLTIRGFHYSRKFIATKPPRSPKRYSLVSGNPDPKMAWPKFRLRIYTKLPSSIGSSWKSPLIWGDFIDEFVRSFPPTKLGQASWSLGRRASYLWGSLTWGPMERGISTFKTHQDEGYFVSCKVICHWFFCGLFVICPGCLGYPPWN